MARVIPLKDLRIRRGWHIATPYFGLRLPPRIRHTITISLRPTGFAIRTGLHRLQTAYILNHEYHDE
jgi:hypothetical protein